MRQIISIVIPVYNATSAIEELNSKLLELFDNESIYEFEIIYVDDASADDSWNVLCDLQKRDSRIRIVQLLKNSGQHIATFCGLEYAKGDLILTMDDDLQHPPEEIHKLIKFLLSNPQCDVVFGIPKIKRHSWFRKMGSKMSMKLIDLSIGKPENISLSSFRLMRRVIVIAILNYRGAFFTLGSLICSVTARIGNVIVEHNERGHGKTNYTVGKLVRLAASNLFNHTVLPLYVISYIGLTTSFVSFLYFLYVVVMKLSGGIHQSGFASIAGIVSFGFGLILLSFGIIGGYIIRITKSINYEKKFMVRQERN